VTKRVLKWVVPVDDETHLVGAGPLVHVGCQAGPDQVMVWTEEDNAPSQTRAVRVYGTGHLIPDGAEHLGSVIAPIPGLSSASLVWHVYQQNGEEKAHG